MSGLSQAEANSFSVAWLGPPTVDPRVVAMAYTMLKMASRHAGCPLPAELDDELKNAQALFMMEILQKQGKILSTTGEIQRQTQGKVTTEMQRIYPLFFFGGQDSSIRGENIASLISHMTFWQLANWIVYNWCEGDIGLDETINLVSDMTTRGAAWNVPESDDDFSSIY